LYVKLVVHVKEVYYSRLSVQEKKLGP